MSKLMKRGDAIERIAKRVAIDTEDAWRPGPADACVLDRMPSAIDDYERLTGQRCDGPTAELIESRALSIARDRARR